MHIFKITLVSLSLIITTPVPLYAYQADVEDLSNNQYLPTTLELLRQAKESIYIVMYLINILPGQTETAPSKLLSELINAHKREVKVNVILDYHKSGKYEEGQISYYAL